MRDRQLAWIWACLGLLATLTPALVLGLQRHCGARSCSTALTFLEGQVFYGIPIACGILGAAGALVRSAKLQWLAAALLWLFVVGGFVLTFGWLDVVFFAPAAIIQWMAGTLTARSSAEEWKSLSSGVS